MDTDAHRYDGPHAQLTFAVIGCALEVLNGLGAGSHEKLSQNALVVEAKVIDRIIDVERGQMLHCLKILGLRGGLIINFKRLKLEWERIVL